MQKRGLSTIIVTLILILVSLVAVGIIWVVVRNVIQTGTEGVGLSQFSLSAKILDVSIDNSSNNVSLTVKRNAGKGELTGISFVFSSDADTEVVTRSVSLKELEQMNFIFHLNTSVSDLTSVSIVPLIKQDEKEIPGIALDKYTLGKSKSYITACIPSNCSILGYSCGNWNNGTCSGTLNCGTCGSGFTCGSGGTCVASCSPTTCSALGYTCGMGYANGTCSGNLNCGNCTSGYNCVGGNCVLQTSSSCGNNILEQGEVCDGTNVSGYTCATLLAGYVSGTLSCNSDCKRYITTSCVAGGTRTAASCSQTDVQNAINLASDGDTVIVPAGNCIWGTMNCHPDSNYCSLVRINKSIFLKSPGIGQVIITNRVPYAWNNVGLHLQSQAGKPIRVSGFTFIHDNISSQRTIYTTGACENLRVDHCKFQSGTDSIFFSTSKGVVDHCEFININTGVRIVGDYDASWNRPIVTGTGDGVFVEDNNFTIDGGYLSSTYNEMVYPQEGARPVLRYNLYNATYFKDYAPPFCSTHGNWGNTPPYYSDYRGQPIYEIYNNKVYSNFSYIIAMLAGGFRGGSQVVYNNNVVKLIPQSNEYIMGFTEEEGWVSGGPWCPNCPLLTSGPAQDQVINSFFWNNTLNGASNNNVYLAYTTINGEGYDNIIIQPNRDFYLHEPQSSGGKAYYVTNQQCTGTKTPTACCTGLNAGHCSAGHNDSLAYTTSGANAYYPYVPYPYPHPLTLIP
jgi:hypothetical protein